MKYIACIPLRGGSKSIPLKNIKEIAGKPLFWWATHAALESGVFDQVIISTDSTQIKESVLALFGNKVSVLDRDPSLALDHTSTEAVMLDVAMKVPSDIFCLIQATSPLVTAQDFQKAKHLFESDSFDSLVTGTRSKRFLWDWSGKPINYNFMQRPRRQEYEGLFQENGAFYFTKTLMLEKFQNRLAGKIAQFEMHEDTAFEIDEPTDWLIVEKLLYLQHKKDWNLTKIKAIVLDVDGTLTDGGMYYDERGEALKKFNTRDAHGLKLLMKQGIKVCIITAEDSPRVHSRMKKLEFEHYFYGVKNKVETLSQWLKTQSLSWDEIVYGGDDVNDLGCLQKSAISFCPHDAVEKVVSSVKYVCKNKSGHGAVREFIDLFLLD